MRPSATVGLAFIACFLAACSNEVIVHAPAAPRPGNAAALTDAVPQDAMVLYDQSGFGGASTTIAELPGAAPAALHPIGGRADSMSSLRWNLPDGVVAMFYDKADGTGRQLGVWGSGQITTLSPSRFEDLVSRWAWFYIGDAPNASAAVLKGRSDRPLGAAPTAGVPDGSVILYRNANFEDGIETVGPATGQPPTAIRDLKKAMHSASSIRWNLPRGTVVVLYADEGGRGQQLVLWGSGQYESLSPFDMNDDAASWAWFKVDRERP